MVQDERGRSLGSPGFDLTGFGIARLFENESLSSKTRQDSSLIGNKYEKITSFTSLLRLLELSAFVKRLFRPVSAANLSVRIAIFMESEGVTDVLHTC